MPAYVPRDAVGVSPAPFPGRDGQPPIDWAVLEAPFGRELTPDERADVCRLLLTYSVRMADAAHAPPVQDVLHTLAKIEDAAGDPSALDELLRGPTQSATLIHVRWQLCDAPIAPQELSAAWWYWLKDKRRRLQDRMDARIYHRKKFPPLWVEGPDGSKVQFQPEPEVTLREEAFRGLVWGIADLWEKSGQAVTVRKDRKKLKTDALSPFVSFLHELLLNLPNTYRRNGVDGLATAASKELRSRSRQRP